MTVQHGGALSNPCSPPPQPPRELAQPCSRHPCEQEVPSFPSMHTGTFIVPSQGDQIHLLISAPPSSCAANPPVPRGDVASIGAEMRLL